MNLCIPYTLYGVNSGYCVEVDIGIIVLALILSLLQLGPCGPSSTNTCKYPV